MSLTGVYSDGTTRDHTSQATWTVSPGGVATVSNGLVSITALGTTIITARYLTRGASARVTATPAGTFVLEGRVREPGGGGIGNVRVLEQDSNTSRQTDNAGNFVFIGLAAARLKVDVNDYEPFEAQIAPPSPLSRYAPADVPLQRRVRINAGQSTGTIFIAPNDVSYTIGSDVCDPCKLIRVFSGGPATLTIRFAWQSFPGGLRLWVNGNRHTTTGNSIVTNTSTGGGETLVYVGWPAGGLGYVNFSVSVD